MQGDRVGICVTQLDPSSVERGWLCSPGSVPTFTAAVAALEKIRFYLGDVRTKQRLHVSVGHATVMADLLFFGLPDGQGESPATALQNITSRIGALAAKVSLTMLHYCMHSHYFFMTSFECWQLACIVVVECWKLEHV